VLSQPKWHQEEQRTEQTPSEYAQSTRRPNVGERQGRPCGALPRRVQPCFLGKSTLKALYLGEVKLRGRCGSLAATVFCSRVRQRFHPGNCRLSALFPPNRRLGLLVPLVSLIGVGLCSRGSRLSMLLLRLQRTLLVLHASKCGLTLQSPLGLASELGEEALAAEPQIDDSGGCCLPCLSGVSAMSRLLIKKMLVTCSLPLTFEGGALVKKTLSCASGLLAGSLLLACTSGMLVEEPLVAGSLFLADASGLLDEECLVLVRPQIVDGRLPIHVGAVRASASPMKNGPSKCPQWQQSGSLLVFENGSLMPFLTLPGGL